MILLDNSNEISGVVAHLDVRNNLDVIVKRSTVLKSFLDIFHLLTVSVDKSLGNFLKSWGKPINTGLGGCCPSFKL
jgi:hypothetical protein